MAGLGCTSTFASMILKPTTMANKIPIPHTITPQRLCLKPLASGTSSPFPTKRTKRKNHLRPKILEALTKPFPTSTIPQIETIPPQNDTFNCTSLKENQSNEELEADGVEELQVSETVTTAGEYRGNIGKFSAKSVLKFGVYFIGVLLFQTICAVCLFGNADSDRKEKNFASFNKKGSVLMDANGNVSYVNEDELEKKVNEIKVMAREARKRESRELIEGNKETEMEKEIGARLVKLEKRLNSKREKLLEYMDLFGNLEDGFEEEGLDLKEENKTLMFNTKEFPGSKDSSGSSDVSDKEPIGVSIETDVGSVEMDRGRNYGNVLLNSVQNEGHNLEKDNGNLPTDIGNGDQGWKFSKAGGSSDLEKQNCKSMIKESQETTTKFDSTAISSRNCGKDSGKSLVAKAGDKQSDVHKDFWWLKLPYVLAIRISRVSGDEESGGPFALEITSQADDEDGLPYTIVFEHHHDANNFCYLLESSEDLGNFSSDIVPLSVKELHEAVTTHSEKVIVVKKGQLKLYVGQPFAEVEMALRSLLEQNQSA